MIAKIKEIFNQRAPKPGYLDFEMAIIRNDLQEVKKLFARGADVNAYNETTPLTLAVFNCNPEISEFLIQSGANPNTKDIHGNTPLYYAAKRGTAEVVEMLINTGADIDAKNSNNATALSATLNSENTEVTEILKKAKKEQETKRLLEEQAQRELEEKIMRQIEQPATARRIKVREIPRI